MAPETKYARLAGLHLAYQVLGQGPPDILLLDQWFSHMEAQWDVRPLASVRERLASFGRLIMFAVDDIDDVVARVLAHGAELVGEVVQYENAYRLAYVRGPEGIIVGLSEQLNQ